MHLKNIRLVFFMVVACFSGTSFTHAQDANFELGAPPPKKINKLDNLIRKVYLMTEDFFADNNMPVPPALPKQGVYIDTAEELALKPDAAVNSDNKAPSNPITGLFASVQSATPSADKASIKEGEPVLAPPPSMHEPVLADPVIGDVKGKIGSIGEGEGISGVLKKRNDEIEAEKNKEEGKGQINPLYWEHLHEEHKKKMEAERKKRKEEEEEAKSKTGLEDIDSRTEKGKIIARNPEDIVPQKRPDYTYRTELLPSSINKKEYNRDNQHLPKAVYEDEYKKILFDSVAVGNIDVMRAMIQRLGTTEIRDSDGNTPLLYAVMAGNLKSVAALVGMDAGIDVKNHDSVSPLYAATKSGRYDMVSVLMRKGAILDIADFNDETPLMVAAKTDDLKISNMLLKRGVVVDTHRRDGNTALHIAAINNSANVAQLLVLKGADTEALNADGRTPLMEAAQNGSEAVTDVLLKAGSDTKRKDATGRNSVKLASEKGFSSIAELIASEDIRRDMKADKVAKENSEKIAVSPTSDIISPEQSSSHKLTSKDDIPVPVRKPYTPKDGKIPQPHFSEAEKAQM